MARWVRSPGLLYLVVSVVFLYDVALTGRAYLLRDILTFFHPWQTAVRELVRAGQLPLWNHDTFCGLPLLANLQSGVFYPLNWLHWVLPFDFSLTLGMILHLTLAGILMHRFLARVGVTGIAAFLGGALFAWGTWTISYLEFPMKLGSAVWLPLLWSGIWDGMRVGRRRGVATAAVAVALSVLAGYPQLTLLGLVSGAVLALFLLPEVLNGPEIEGGARAHRALVLPASLAVAGLLAAAQLLPSAEMAGLSGKAAAYDAAAALSRSLPPKGLIGLVDPFFLGFPGVDRYWGGELVEFCFGAFHVGAMGLILAGIALPTLRGPRKRMRRHRGEVPEPPVVLPEVTRFLLVGLLVAMVLALGRFTPVYPFLHEWVPGFGRIRWPATAGFLVAAHLAPLAAIGLARVRRDRAHIGRVAFVALGAGVALLVVWLLARDVLAEPIRALQLAGSPAYQQAAYDTWREEWLGSLLLRAAFLVAAGAIGLALRDFRTRAALAWTSLAVLDLFLVARAFEMPVDRGFYGRVPAPVRELAAELDGKRIYTPRSTDQLGNFLYGCRNPTAFAWAQRAMLCNANVPAGIAQANGCDPLGPRRHDAFTQAFHAEGTPHVIRERIFDLWDAARLLEVQGVRPLDVPLVQDPAKGITFNPHRPRLGRANLMSGWRVLDDGPAVLDELLSGAHDPRRTTLLEVPEGVAPPDSLESEATGPADAVEWGNGPNSIRVAWVVGGGGMLRVLESWAPGWEARVNGEPAPVYRADFLFLAVPVPPGSVELELAYRPQSVPIGLALSALGLIALAILAVPRGGGAKRVELDED